MGEAAGRIVGADILRVPPDGGDFLDPPYRRAGVCEGEREGGRVCERETDRQTDGRTDRERDRERERERTYYVCHQTKETSWTLPTASRVLSPALIGQVVSLIGWGFGFSCLLFFRCKMLRLTD